MEMFLKILLKTVDVCDHLKLMFWNAVMGRVCEIDGSTRNHDNKSHEASLIPGSSAITSASPAITSGSPAITSARRGRVATTPRTTFYRATRRDFYVETAVVYRRPGLPRYDYVGDEPDHRPYTCTRSTRFRHATDERRKRTRSLARMSAVH